MTLDARLLMALRATQVHLPATDLAAQLAAPLRTVEQRLTELRSAGFNIEERPGLGFRLVRSPERLIADDLLSRLGPSELVREIVVFAETGSTNDIAMQRGRQGADGGLVVFAERQTSGRGRFGRHWASARMPRAVVFLLMRPSFPVIHWPRLTTWAAVSPGHRHRKFDRPRCPHQMAQRHPSRGCESGRHPGGKPASIPPESRSPWSASG